MKRTIAVIAAAAYSAAVSALGASPAHADPAPRDPTKYFDSLTYFGITVAGNEDFLLRLANMSCAMHDAGMNSGEIAEVFTGKYGIPSRDGHNIASGAWVYYCP